MVVPNESIAVLAELTSLPGDWVKEWAAGKGVPAHGGGTVRSRRQVAMRDFCLNKVNLETLPWAAPRDRSPA